MKISALIVALVSVLLLAVAMAGAEGPTTDAARPPDFVTAPGHGIRVVANGCPGPAAMSEELKRLLGSEAYPGAPSAADLGFTGPRCEIDPGPCDWLEDEPICEGEWVDSWNGGCNSAPSVFDTLYASYGRITLVGTSGTFAYGPSTSRDTDWYEIHLSEATEITFCCTAEFPLQTVLIDGTAGCVSMNVIDVQQIDACQELCMTHTVGPGTYWLWVGPIDFTGVPCGEEYVMTIDGFYAVNCDVVCPGEGIVENEPACYPEYVDAWNGGCNSTPYVFQSLDPSERTITVCGETGVYSYSGFCYRDTDWYEIILDQRRELEVCAFGDFPIQLLIVGGPCESSQVLNFGQAEACAQTCISDTLDPGTYWLWVGAWYFVPIDCGRQYTMTVSGYTTSVEHSSWGSIKALYR